MKKEIFKGLAKIAQGCSREVALNAKALLHGHYFPEDANNYCIAEAERRMGVALLTGNDQEYKYGMDNIKEYKK